MFSLAKKNLLHMN